MASLVVLCTDGSDLSVKALAAGLALLGSDVTPLVATVVEEGDPVLVSGTGMAGGVMSPEEFDRQEAAVLSNGEQTVAAAAEALGLPDAERVVLRGDAATAVCELAEQRQAAAIVIGSRGRGGIKRAVLGSVSDHIVRHAPCSVVVTGPHATEG